MFRCMTLRALWATLGALFVLGQLQANDDSKPAPRAISNADAARFLTQATFGPSLPDINAVKAIGFERWIDAQLTRRGPNHLNYVRRHSNGSNRAARHEIWWRDAVRGKDQLRQRVAYALSQLFVISDIGYTLANQQYGVTHYYDTLRRYAFGNYRELLERVTLSPVMGLYLSMAKNERANIARNIRPDENYAREVLQLFSIGLHELRLDGSYRLNANGQRRPTFNQAIVKEFARVFTGWHFNGVDSWDRTYYGQDLIGSMRPWRRYHDAGSKRLLRGETIPARLSPQRDMTRALNNIFRHPNVAPFITKQLIQRLVTSNPTPGYVRRVARVFNNNGRGKRGDLGAVVRAILLDDEARNGHNKIAGFGKLREPVLRLSHLWRAFPIAPGAISDHGEYNTSSPALYYIDSQFGQAPLRSSSVFNFYHPHYAPLGPVKSAGMVAPEFEIASENSVLLTTSRLSSQIQYHYKGGVQNAVNTAFINLDREIAMAGNPPKLLNHLNVLLLSGSMSQGLRQLLLTHLDKIPSTAAGRSQRARDAITLIVASPDYLIQM